MGARAVTTKITGSGSPVLRLLISTPDFFGTPYKKLTLEHNEGAGRTYFLKGDKIVAVAALKEALRS